MEFSAKLIFYRGESRIAVLFEKNQRLIIRIKEFEDARWSNSKQLWHLPDTVENRDIFKIIQHHDTIPSLEGISQISKFKQHLASKRYSDNTIKTYCDALRSFFVFYRNKSIAEITNEDVIIYNNDFILKNNFSASYQNTVSSSSPRWILQKKLSIT